MNKCKACKFFDCGSHCECVCHSQYKDDYPAEPPKHPSWQEQQGSMEGLNTLFG